MNEALQSKQGFAEYVEDLKKKKDLFVKLWNSNLFLYLRFLSFFPN